MTRRSAVLAVFALFALFALVPLARSEEPKPPVLAADDVAAAAVATFKEEFKAKGLKGEEKTSQRDWAMSKIAKVQHPAVVDTIAGVLKGSDATLRTIAVLYLGEMKALPGPAGREVAVALERNKKDLVFVLSALDSVGALRYLGAKDALGNMLKDDDFVTKKAAVLAAGRTRDVRLLPDLLKILGIETKGGDSGGEVVVQEGYSWEGAEASVDTGTAGDGDQQAAEAAVRAQMAANQAAAAAAAGARGGSGGESARGGGGSSRSLKELAPHVLKALKQITGAELNTAKDIATWLGKNREWVAEETKRVEAEAKKQSEQR